MAESMSMRDDQKTAVAEFIDPVIEAYKKDIDRTLLRENLKLTPAQRLEKLQRFAEFVQELQDAGRRARKRG
jgi:hypothetical protein